MRRTIPLVRWEPTVVLLALTVSGFNCAGSAGMPGGTGTGGSSGGEDASVSTGTGGSTGNGSGGSTATTGSGGSTQSGGSTGSGSGGNMSTGSGGNMSTGSGGSMSTGSGGSTSTGSGGSTAACAGTLVRCNGACVDTTGSPVNCGACGKTCRSDQTCWQSQCTCATGQADCGGVCKDVQSSNVNCGKCDNMCATGATCMAGECKCPTDQVACSGVCKAVLTDTQNCGKCGTVCSGGTMCLFGGCLDPSSLACSPSSQSGKTSTKDASIILGKYWVNNNQWGISGASGSQSIWSTCQQGDLIGWGTSWTWSGTSNQVKTYASVVFGWQWGWKVSNTGLPLQLSSGKKVTCGWDYSMTNTGGSANVAFDIFLHSIQMPGTNDDPTDEIMIWLDVVNGAGPIGTKQTTVTIGSASWDLYRGAITTSSGATRWNVFSFVRTMNATTAIVGVSDFLGDLVTRGWVQNSKYLTSIQSGTEVFTGTGQLDTKGYYCRIQ